jgi:hypothetical protein
MKTEPELGLGEQVSVGQVIWRRRAPLKALAGHGPGPKPIPLLYIFMKRMKVRAYGQLGCR